MQNTVRWRSDWLDGAVVGSSWGKPSQKKSDANVEGSDCKVRMLFSISIQKCSVSKQEKDKDYS